MSFRVMLVDDEESLVWSLQHSVRSARPHWALEAFTDPLAAIVRLRAAPPDVLITDLRMPGLSGTELLVAAREVAPAMPVVVVTAYGTPEIAALLRQRTGVAYLEKPVELDALLRAVERLRAEVSGFSGAISLPMLPDLLQIYTLSRSTAALTVSSAEGSGTIWIDRGEIVHAACGTLVGDEAVYELLAWRGGTFALAAEAAAPRVTIAASWQELLLEGCRRIDERNRDGAADGEAAASPSNGAERLLEALRAALPGLIAAAVVDPRSGRSLGAVASGDDADAAAPLVGEALRRALAAGSAAPRLEDVLFTFDDRLHFLRAMPSGDVLVLAADRAATGNLALLRSVVARQLERLALTSGSSTGGRAASKE